MVSRERQETDIWWNIVARGKIEHSGNILSVHSTNGAYGGYQGHLSVQGFMRGVVPRNFVVGLRARH